MHLPKSMLIHSVVYREALGDDGFGGIQYADDVTIYHVRFDNMTLYSKSVSATTVVANGTVYVDGKHSTPLYEFKERSIIVFEGVEYTIVKASKLFHPHRNILHHWELDVL